MNEQESILLVDDDLVFLQVLERSFQRNGFLVKTARTAKDAIGIARSTPLNKAVLDLKIDRDSGLALLPDLKRLQPKIEIIILTGYSSIATAVEAIKLGALNYLCKPVDTDEVLRAFQNLGGNADAPIEVDPPSVSRLEWEHIQQVLQDHQGNISATARALGMHRRTLQRKLAKRPVRK